jgi:hypothetical protein
MKRRSELLQQRERQTHSPSPQENRDRNYRQFFLRLHDEDENDLGIAIIDPAARHA